MVVICVPDFSGSCGHGYTPGPWASAGTVWKVEGDRCAWAPAGPAPAAPGA
jgi:hypothetical protein